jgi:hypothetical protein
MNIRERCIEKLKDKNKLRFISKNDIVEYLSNNFDVAISKNIKKTELIDILEGTLKEESLLLFVESFPEMGLTQFEISELYGCSKAQLNRFIKKGRLNKVHEIQNSEHKYIVTYLYNILDVIDLYESGEYPKAKKEKTYDLELSDENIAESLYIINKSAKKSRDTKVRGYCNKAHRVCHAAKTRSYNLYHLKDCVIEKLMGENRIQYLGIVKQKIHEKVIYLDEYRLKDFCFHVPHKGKVDEDEVLDKIICGEIPATVTRNNSLSFNEAKWILEKYSGEKATGGGKIHDYVPEWVY